MERDFKFFRDRRRTDDDDDDARARLDGTDCERFQTNETNNVAIDGATTIGGGHGGEHGGGATE